MTKEKVMSLMPGDDVTIHLHIKCSDSTLLRISAVTIEDLSSSDLNVVFDI